MKKLNRNNAKIKKILNKKVAIICDSKEKELDFRKWAKQYVNAVDEDYVYTNCGNGICIKVQYYGLKWDFINYFLENNYSIYEWEIAEEEKMCTIRDIVDNKGKLYKDEHDTLYFYDDKLYCRTREEKKFRPSLLNLQQMLDLELTEYKEEPIKITFEEALKEMEKGKVCRCLFSNRCIIINASHFMDCSNGVYTSLSLPEIQSDWVVVNE